LQAAHPECTTVSIVCAWFGNSTDASACQIYPSTTYIFGQFQSGAENWQCSGLTQNAVGFIPGQSTPPYSPVIPIPTAANGSFIYGGTPSDQSIVRCIRDLKSRGFKVIFYPFILMTATGEPWRGRITYSPDVSSVSRLGGALAIHARRDEPHGRLFRIPDRLHLSAHDPALRLAGDDRGRRQPVPARVRTARP
jgi:hypothetical protein